MIETRPVSVIGIIVWSIVISICALALVKMTETFSRVVAYSQLASSESLDDENGIGIECGVISSRDATDHFSIDDTSTGDNETEQDVLSQLNGSSSIFQQQKGQFLDFGLAHGYF